MKVIASGASGPTLLLDAAFQSELEDRRVFWMGERPEQPLKYTHQIKEWVKDGVLRGHHALATRVADVDRDAEIASVMSEPELLCLLLCHESKQFKLLWWGRWPRIFDLKVRSLVEWRGDVQVMPPLDGQLVQIPIEQLLGSCTGR